jgi:hypothetical protein
MQVAFEIKNIRIHNVITNQFSSITNIICRQIIPVAFVSSQALPVQVDQISTVRALKKLHAI